MTLFGIREMSKNVGFIAFFVRKPNDFFKFPGRYISLLRKLLSTDTGAQVSLSLYVTNLDFSYYFK
jgi:hypothetical protein